MDASEGSIRSASANTRDLPGLPAVPARRLLVPDCRSVPRGLGDNWYYTDDVYIGFDDGYYLYSRNDPSVAIAITVMP